MTLLVHVKMLAMLNVEWCRNQREMSGRKLKRGKVEKRVESHQKHKQAGSKTRILVCKFKEYFRQVVCIFSS